VRLDDRDWSQIRRWIPRDEFARSKPGRPFRHPRDVLDGIVWVLRTGAPWNTLPEKYPPYQTCHRRMQRWVRIGLLRGILRRIAARMRRGGRLDLREAFIDGTHAGAKRAGALVGKTRRGKATKIMAIVDAQGLPLAVYIASGQRHEVKLVEETLARRFVDDVPQRLIGDMAYDSNQLDERLAADGVELIAPHNPTRRRKTQDGRPLRRYRRRWLVERLFAWLLSFRRLVTRWEAKADNFQALVELACLLILLRN
jgi:transposase